jgi:hypothetical protein
MFKILIVSYIWSSSGNALDSKVVDFDTREQADAAIANINADKSSLVGLKVTALYSKDKS